MYNLLGIQFHDLNDEQHYPRYYDTKTPYKKCGIYEERPITFTDHATVINIGVIFSQTEIDPNYLVKLEKLMESSPDTF